MFTGFQASSLWHDVLKQTDYLSGEEPAAVDNLMKIQKKTGIYTFNYNLVKAYYLFRNADVFIYININSQNIFPLNLPHHCIVKWINWVLNILPKHIHRRWIHTIGKGLQCILAYYQFMLHLNRQFPKEQKQFQGIQRYRKACRVKLLWFRTSFSNEKISPFELLIKKERRMLYQIFSSCCG